MKQLTSYNRVAGYLNKLFDLLNEHYFESALVRPTITIQSTPRAYGHFSTRDDTWVTLCGQRSASISLVWIVARRWCLRDETDTKKQRPMCEPKKPYIGRFFVKVEEYEP